MKNPQAVLDSIRSTRAISLPQYGTATPKGQSGTSAHTTITEVDEAIETHLAAALKELEPDIAYVGEEFGGDRSAPRYWLVDPIDGTTHYVRGMPFCTTMVALIEEGEVTFGAIYDFVNDVMYHAVAGGGAFQDGEPISVSDRNLDNAYVCLEANTQDVESINLLIAMNKRCITVKTICSGFEHAAVATGKLDARICHNPYGYDYDFAPGTLLIKEAGGVVTNIGSDRYDHTNVNYIAANPIVHKKLTEGPDALLSK